MNFSNNETCQISLIKHILSQDSTCKDKNLTVVVTDVLGCV